MSSMFRLRRLGIYAAIAAVLCLAGSGTLQAQTTSASVQGTVVDAQQAVMPGVTVTLESRTQGDVLTTVTDEGGRFVFTIVRPGAYILKAALEGFKTLEQTNLVVNANDKLSAGTLVLEVGALTESISVTARVTELQANSGERSFTMENDDAHQHRQQRARDVQLRHVGALACCTRNDGAGGEMAQVSGFTVNGQRPNSNNMTIDGVANIDTGDNGGNMATTNIDSVAEFKILTNAYQAEYGRAVGGQIQVVTKSGTNDFRGSAYWYGRRSNWNATRWIEQPRQPHDAQVVTRRPGLHDRRAGDEEEAVLLLEPGVPVEAGPCQRASHQGADGAGACGRFLPERGQQRQPVPLYPRLHDGVALQRDRYARVLRRRRGARQDPGKPPQLAGHQRPEDLSDPERQLQQRRKLHEPGTQRLASP